MLFLLSQTMHLEQLLIWLLTMLACLLFYYQVILHCARHGLDHNCWMNWCWRVGISSSHPSPSVLIPALRTVGNIVTGDDLQTQVVFETYSKAVAFFCSWSFGRSCFLISIIELGLALLQTCRMNVSLSLLLCVHCCNAWHFLYQFVINNQALPCLLALLTRNHKKSIKKEACWTISNITAGNKDQIQVCAFFYWISHAMSTTLQHYKTYYIFRIFY